MKRIKSLTFLLMIVLAVSFVFGWSSAEEKAITHLQKDDGNISSEKNSDKNVVVIEGDTYKGYKGPVQGEIKYKEGTPAKQNSGEYKASGDIESLYNVDLIVTTDFGHKKVFSKNVGLVKDEVGMEVLFRNLDIETVYGGGFVNSINGIESKFTFFTGKNKKKQDWFYWVNGILAPIGVAEYTPNSGDVIWWDYHDWSITMFAPAVIGSYPQPFKSGAFGKNPGTVIMYADGYKEDAQKLKQNLINQGVKQIDIAKYNNAVLKKPKKYYILLGTWEQLSKKSKLMKDINRKNKLVGTYVKFEDGKVKGLDFKGKTKLAYDHAGAIYAYAAGIGSVKPIWMITGTDDSGVNMALDTILNNPKGIDKHFSVVISKKGIENVPYIN